MMSLEDVYDACMYGDLEQLAGLLAYGLPLDDYYVHQAASKGHVHVLKFLRANNNNNLSGLFKYAFLNRQVEAIEYLLEIGFGPTSVEEIKAVPPVLPGEYCDEARDMTCFALVKRWLMQFEE